MGKLPILITEKGNNSQIVFQCSPGKVGALREKLYPHREKDKEHEKYVLPSSRKNNLLIRIC